MVDNTIQRDTKGAGVDQGDRVDSRGSVSNDAWAGERRSIYGSDQQQRATSSAPVDVIQADWEHAHRSGSSQDWNKVETEIVDRLKDTLRDGKSNPKDVIKQLGDAINEKPQPGGPWLTYNPTSNSVTIEHLRQASPEEQERAAGKNAEQLRAMGFIGGKDTNDGSQKLYVSERSVTIPLGEKNFKGPIFVPDHPKDTELERKTGELAHELLDDLAKNKGKDISPDVASKIMELAMYGNEQLLANEAALNKQLSSSGYYVRLSSKDNQPGYQGNNAKEISMTLYKKGQHDPIAMHHSTAELER